VKGKVATLGPLVTAWIEAKVVIPDGPHQGQPYRLTEEMRAFVNRFYAIDSTGRWLYERGGQLVRSQKWGKSPFLGALAIAEAAGPTRFAGWAKGKEQTAWGYAYAPGDPMGAVVPTPHIQVAASSIDQAGNCWRLIPPMIALGPLADEIPDVGETRVNLPDGGRMEPVTAAAISRLGARITFGALEETHQWNKSNRGRELGDVMKRNLAGTGSRWIEATNAWDPAEESVAQITAESEAAGVLLDDREPGAGSIDNVRDLRRMLREAYGDAAAGSSAADGTRIEPWRDLYRIESEFRTLQGRDPSQAVRYFLNRKVAAELAAFDLNEFNGRILEGYRPPDGATITIGIDGARNRDSIAIVVCEPSSGFVWAPLILERPEGAPEDYLHDLEQVDGAVADLFAAFTVERMLVDPFGLEPLLERWESRYGTPPVFRWQMNRPRQVAHAVRALSEAIAAGDLSHDGDPDLTRHLGNAQRQKVNVVDDAGRQMWTISKDRFDSPRKIDGAAALVLAWEARAKVASEPEGLPEVPRLAILGGGPGPEWYQEILLAREEYFERHPAERPRARSGSAWSSTKPERARQ